MDRKEYWTEENADWFASRVTESNTGKILVPLRLVEKYRKALMDLESSNSTLRFDIVSELQLKGKI